MFRPQRPRSSTRIRVIRYLEWFLGADWQEETTFWPKFFGCSSCIGIGELTFESTLPRKVYRARVLHRRLGSLAGNFWMSRTQNFKVKGQRSCANFWRADICLYEARMIGVVLVVLSLALVLLKVSGRSIYNDTVAKPMKPLFLNTTQSKN